MDQVALIINGPSSSTATTHWTIAGMSTGQGAIGIYADHTFRYQCYLCNTAQITSGTWTQLGRDAMVLNPADLANSLNSINGSVGQGTFTATPGAFAPLLFSIAGGSL